MTKAKKEVDLKHFEIIQVENGWRVIASPVRHWWDYNKNPTETDFVFIAMIDLLDWIEANI